MRIGTGGGNGGSRGRVHCQENLSNRPGPPAQPADPLRLINQDQEIEYVTVANLVRIPGDKRQVISPMRQMKSTNHAVPRWVTVNRAAVNVTPSAGMPVICTSLRVTARRALRLSLSGRQGPPAPRSHGSRGPPSLRLSGSGTGGSGSGRGQVRVNAAEARAHQQLETQILLSQIMSADS